MKNLVIINFLKGFIELFLKELFLFIFKLNFHKEFRCTLRYSGMVLITNFRAEFGQ